MRLYAIISMTIVFAILAWIVDLNIAHANGVYISPADCLGAEVGGGCVGIPVPSDRPYRYDDHDRDHPAAIEHPHHYRGPAVVEPHNDEDED